MFRLPAGTEVQRVADGVETSTFKGEFGVWDLPRTFKPSGLGTSASSNLPHEEVNVAALFARKAVEETPVDDGSGTLKIWLVIYPDIVLYYVILPSSFFIISYHIISYHIISYQIISYQIVPGDCCSSIRCCLIDLL